MAMIISRNLKEEQRILDTAKSTKVELQPSVIGHI